MPDHKTGWASSFSRHFGLRPFGAATVPVLALAILLPALAVGLLLSELRPHSNLISQVSMLPASKALPVEVGLESSAGQRNEAPAGRTIERWHSDQIYLVDSASWSEHSLQMVNEALADLPESVRIDLGNPELGGLYISVNREGRTMSGQEPYHRAANFFSTNEGRNEVVLFPDQSPRTAMHELGHAYNLRRISAGSYAQVYLDDEMKSFLQASKWRVLTSTSDLRNIRDQADVQVAYDGVAIWTRLSRDDPLEDFANSFAVYFTAPLELKALSPGRYDWFVSHFATN